MKTITHSLRRRAKDIAERAQTDLNRKTTEVRDRIQKYRREVITVTNDVQKRIDRVAEDIAETSRILEEKSTTLRQIVNNILDRVEEVRGSDWFRDKVAAFSKTSASAEKPTAPKKTAKKKAGRKIARKTTEKNKVTKTKRAK